MIAAGAAAHSDHGRGVAETFLAVARKESKDYTIKDPARLIQIAPYFGVATTVEVTARKWTEIYTRSLSVLPRRP
jgi:anaerobic carbon-monoxide dehydrogenase catalytic subunit